MNQDKIAKTQNNKWKPKMRVYQSKRSKNDTESNINDNNNNTHNDNYNTPFDDTKHNYQTQNDNVTNNTNEHQYTQYAQNINQNTTQNQNTLTNDNKQEIYDETQHNLQSNTRFQSDQTKNDPNKHPQNISTDYKIQNDSNTFKKLKPTHIPRRRKYNKKYISVSSARAPIEECNTEFMRQITIQNKHNLPGIQRYRYRYWEDSQWQESESLTVGKLFYSKQGSNIQTWNKPQIIMNNDNYDETFKQYPWKNQVHFNKQNDLEIKMDNIESFEVNTNTYPITLNNNINVLEYEIKITPKMFEDEWGFRTHADPVSYKILRDLEKRFKRFEKKQIMQQYFKNEYVIQNTTFLTFEHRNNNAKYEHIIQFPDTFDEWYIFEFTFKSIHSLHFYAGIENELNDDEKQNETDDFEDEMSPERRTQIFQFILSTILSKSGFKLLRFRASSKGWFPANSNENLNHVSTVYKHPKSEKLKKIGILRGFNVSVCSAPSGAALKVSNANKILDAKSLNEELKELFESDVDNYEHNLHIFLHRKALYLPTQTVLEIRDIKLDQNEETTFNTNRNGKDIEISHKQNLLDRNMVTHVSPEKYGLVINKYKFSYLPQFIHLLDDVSLKQVKDANAYLMKNVDYELESVKQFVSHIINTQKQNSHENDTMSINALSLINISPNPIRTTAYPLQKMKFSFKTDKDTFINCNELTIPNEWKNIKDTIICPEKKVKILLYGDSKSMVTKVGNHINKYFEKRIFPSLIIEEVQHCIPNDIWDINELKQILIDNEYGLLILILPNINDGSRLKRKAHQICLELGIRTQFVSDECFYDSSYQKKQRDIVFGFMSDVLFKLGVTTYSIHSKSIFDKSMVLGLDICHPTSVRYKSRPSIAVVTSLYGNIMTPNICQQKSAMFLNENRQELCGYKSCIEMFISVITQQLLRNDINELPLNIFMFRDGVNESQIPEMVSKELTALLLAVRNVKKLENIKQKYDINNLKIWKPKFEWIVIQKRILDRFAIIKTDNIKIKHHSPPFIIPSDIVNGKYFDYYFQIGLRKPKRIIFIKDDLKLKEKNLIYEIAQYIYNLHWLYPFSLPFPLGPIGIVSPIKFADHYANMWQDIINYDHTIHNIHSNINLHYPQMVTLDKHIQNDLESDANE